MNTALVGDANQSQDPIPRANLLAIWTTVISAQTTNTRSMEASSQMEAEPVIMEDVHAVHYWKLSFAQQMAVIRSSMFSTAAQLSKFSVTFFPYHYQLFPFRLRHCRMVLHVKRFPTFTLSHYVYKFFIELFIGICSKLESASRTSLYSS